MLAFACALAMAATQVETGPEIVLFSRAPIDDSTRSIWSSTDGSSTPLGTGSRFDVLKIEKALDAKGYIVKSAGSTIVGVDKYLKIFELVRRKENLVALLRSVGKNATLDASPSGDATSKSLFDHLASVFPGFVSNSVSVSLAPTFLLLSGSKSEGRFVEITLEPSEDVHQQLSERPIKIDTTKALQVTQKPISKPGTTGGVHTNWSPAAGTPDTIAKANAVFSQLWVEQLDKAALMDATIHDYLRRQFGDKIGNDVPSGPVKLSDLSPWLSGQVTQALSSKYESLGFSSSDEANKAFQRGDRFRLELNISKVYGLQDANGTVGLYVETG